MNQIVNNPNQINVGAKRKKPSGKELKNLRPSKRKKTDHAEKKVELKKTQKSEQLVRAQVLLKNQDVDMDEKNIETSKQNIQNILKDTSHPITKAFTAYCKSPNDSSLCDALVLYSYAYLNDDNPALKNSVAVFQENQNFTKIMAEKFSNRLDFLKKIMSFAGKPEISYNKTIDVYFDTKTVKNKSGKIVIVTKDAWAQVKKINKESWEIEEGTRKTLREYNEKELDGIKNDTIGHIIARSFMTGKNARQLDIKKNIFPENNIRNSDFSHVEGALMNEVKPVGKRPTGKTVFIYVHLNYGDPIGARPISVQRGYFVLDKNGSPITTSARLFSLNPLPKDNN